MARALQTLVVETAARASSHDRRIGHANCAERLPHLQPCHDFRHVRYQALRQVTHLSTRICDDLLTLAVIELLRHRERLAGRPAEARAAEFLQRRQVVQLGRALSLVFDPHGERALEPFSCFDDVLRNLALEDSLLRRVAHLEVSARNFRRSDNFKIGDWHELADFQLTHAYDGQGWRLHTTNADHPARTLPKNDGRGAGERQIVNLVGLAAGNRGGVKAGIFGIWSCPTECLADGLLVLRGEQHPHHLATVFIMLDNFLTDELTLAVAIGGEPNPLSG